MNIGRKLIAATIITAGLAALSVNPAHATSTAWNADPANDVVATNRVLDRSPTSDPTLDILLWGVSSDGSAATVTVVVDEFPDLHAPDPQYVRQFTAYTDMGAPHPRVWTVNMHNGEISITSSGTSCNETAWVNPEARSFSLRIPFGCASPVGRVSLSRSLLGGIAWSEDSAGKTFGGGYRMVTASGEVHSFGSVWNAGDVPVARGAQAVDIESTARGYLVLTSDGVVSAARDQQRFGNATLAVGERANAISATPSGLGYWIFTDKGRVIAFGDAKHFGDMAGVSLNGPVLDAIATPSGKGYYMVASDGGIFAFGDAQFYGSMGGRPLNAPVQSLVPDPDGVGYWLVASDGGVFAFDAPFRGSMGGVRLNRPVSGMVPNGNGYLMVGEDGGIFNFSDQPFAGSLGSMPPSSPVVSVSVAS
jgi:hypothetical protein